MVNKQIGGGAGRDAIPPYQKGKRNLRCQACGGMTSSTDGRLLSFGGAAAIYRRRRVCRDCGLRFSTYEIHVELYRALVADSRRVSKLEKTITSLEGLKPAVRMVARLEAAKKVAKRYLQRARRAEVELADLRGVD